MKSNGEFKGRVDTEIRYLREDVRDIKDKLNCIETKLDNNLTDITTLKTKSGIYGAVAGFLASAGLAVILNIVF